MLLLKTLFFQKIDRVPFLLPTAEPPTDPTIHWLKIEFHQDMREGSNDLIPRSAYHFHDNQSTKDLTGVHMVLTAHYNSTNRGEMFRLFTSPYNLQKNFSPVLKWRPEDIVDALVIAEKTVTECTRNNFIFSGTDGWKIQYFGLIRELYRKKVGQ